MIQCHPLSTSPATNPPPTILSPLPPPMSGRARDPQPPPKKLEWDWDLEHQDRAKEAKADRAVHNAQPFLVDRKILKDVVKEKFHVDVARIVFLSSGKFRKSTEHIPPLTVPLIIAGTFHKVNSSPGPRTLSLMTSPRLILSPSSMALSSLRGSLVDSCPESRRNLKLRPWTFCASTQKSPFQPSFTTMLAHSTDLVESTSSCPR